MAHAVGLQGREGRGQVGVMCSCLCGTAAKYSASQLHTASPKHKCKTQLGLLPKLLAAAASCNADAAMLLESSPAGRP